MTLLRRWQMQWLSSTLPPMIHAGLCIMGAPVILADLEKLPTWALYDLYGSNSTVEAWKTLMRQRMRPLARLRAFATRSPYLSLWLYFLVAVCIVTGLYAMLYRASNGCRWLLP